MSNGRHAAPQTATAELAARLGSWRSVLALGFAAVIWFLAPSARAAEDVYPPTSPTAPQFTDDTGLLVESTSAGDRRVRGSWSPARDGGSGIADYRVQLSETPDFETVSSDRYTGTDRTYTEFTPDDGIDYGHTYYFRVLARDVAGNESDWSSPSNAVSVREDPAGPAIAHAPVMTAHHGRQIPIVMTATCADPLTCSATLAYRSTGFDDTFTLSLPTEEGFTRVAMERGASTTLNGRHAYEWSAMIPGDVVTTTGVDYAIEAEDTLATAYFPGTTFTGTQYSPGVEAYGTYHHVHTVTPPLLSHTPPVFGRSDNPLPLTLRAACSTGACTATLHFRTTDGPISETVVAYNGELLATPDWPSVEMTAGAFTEVDDGTEVLTYTAEIPASFVDTRGVDYFFHVTDGYTNAWWPGTTYEGYYAPLDGMRTGYHHVRVAETPHIVHAPVTTSPYREPISITAHANCPSTRVCTGTLYYRTATTHVLDTTVPFEDAPMTASRLESVDGNDVVEVRGEIPASVADTRGVDYFFSFTDGATTSWFPGVSPNDGYALTDGVRVAYQHVRILEPPHIVHVPVVTTHALRDLTISADVTCATEACTADLTYTTDPSDPWAVVTVPMQKTGERETTLAGRTEIWEYVVPAEHVTTRGFAYLIEAHDGYVSTAAPGTFYAGAYVQVEGGTISHETSAAGALMYPVHVAEPPHPVHVPSAVAWTGLDLDIDVTTNCATAACTATLHWYSPGTGWVSGEMTLTDVTAEEVWSFRATVPGTDVTRDGVTYRIEVSDGYVEAWTPTWTTPGADPLTL